jgi:precorrin-6B methylase 2
LCKGIKVFAVEKDQQNIAFIRENIKRYMTYGVHVVYGSAPQCLAGLPSPDRVFVGGGGIDLYGILSFVWGQLKENGILVINTITVTSVAEVMRFFQDVGAPCELVVLNVAKANMNGSGCSSPIIRAANPVHIFVCDVENTTTKERKC